MINIRIALSMLLTTAIAFGTYKVEAAMSFEQALSYQNNYKDEFPYFTEKAKDSYGEKKTFRYFSCLGNHGVFHPGESMFNVVVNYGPVGTNPQPNADIHWMAAMKGMPDKGYAPKSLVISFNDGTIKHLDLQGWEYTPQFMPYYGYIHYYTGTIKLNDFQLYELTQHSGLTNIGVEGDGNYTRFCFFSGDKEIKKKEKLRIGLKHALNVLQIDENALLARKAEYEKQQEALRLAKMRAEIEKEIKEEQERAEMKKQILAEMEAKKRAVK